MRTATLLSPNRLRITTDRVSREYRLEIWTTRQGHVIELSYEFGPTYYISVSNHTNPRQQEWRCTCPAMTHNGGQCKHVLAIKAGLRKIGVKI